MLALPFSLLWSPTICNPLVSLSALCCIFDLIIICVHTYQLRHYPERNKPIYFKLIAFFIAHFYDTKMLHYIPLVEKGSNDLIMVVWLSGSLGLLLRLLLILVCYQSMESLENEATLSKDPAPRRQQMRMVLKFIPWYAGGALAVYVGVLCFLAGYNLITVQLGWLLKMIFAWCG